MTDQPVSPAPETGTAPIPSHGWKIWVALVAGYCLTGFLGGLIYGVLQ